MEVVLPVECPCHPAGASLIKHKELNVLLDSSRELTLCWFWKAVGIWCFILEWFGWVTPFPSLIYLQHWKGSSEASMALMGQLNNIWEGYFQRITWLFVSLFHQKGGKGFYSRASCSIPVNVQPNASAKHSLGQCQYSIQAFEQAPGTPGRGKKEGNILFIVMIGGFLSSKVSFAVESLFLVL